MKKTYYMVRFEDGCGCSWNYGLDPDCNGGLSSDSRLPSALFESRGSARRAIHISVANDRLKVLQGVYKEGDWTKAMLAQIKIVPCVVVEPAAKTKD